MNKKILFVTSSIIIVAVIIIGAWFAFQPSGLPPVTNFMDCERAGYPILESYPRQCRTPEGQFFTEELVSPPAVPDMIQVDTPERESVVQSPVKVSGIARGYWYFEASFPVRVVDANGQELGVNAITAGGDWMTKAYVPFSGEVSFKSPTTETGFVIFERDNPSGLPENAAEYAVPVRFKTAQKPASLTLKAYFSNSTLLQAGQDDCATTFPVERTVSYTVETARAAVEQLLQGPTPAEKQQGYATNINSGVKIQKLVIQNGVASIDFDKQLEESVGGSCRVIAIRSEIMETLKQFPTVNEVVISIDGRTEDILQP